jgi:hypothetical protein
MSPKILAAHTILRHSVVGMENSWVKMFDPPTESPVTPERLAPTNPVPEFMASLGLSDVATLHTVKLDLLHGVDITMWDGKKVKFFTFRDGNLKSPFNGGHFPGPTLRIPRGVVFHCETQGHGPPPHTIHWHGIEPTAINDGVGHCSMEIGQYTYQWQPNYIGTYFFHCHRNTMQHFEYGLYGTLLIEPPDAYATGPGKNPGGYPRRTAANLTNFPEFPGFVGGLLTSGDPQAMTVPYDVEALWVVDDVDSVWREKMPNAKDTYPEHGDQPGVNDTFHKGDFHDFNPDYFVVTGVNFPGTVGSTASIPPGVTIPAALNGGVTGMQVSVNTQINKTVLIRTICAAYVGVKVTFPVDVVLIAYDGRALGVPPFGQYNRPFLVTAGTPIELSTARRFDVLLRSSTPIDSFANVEFRHNRNNSFLLNGRIPIKIV